MRAENYQTRSIELAGWATRLTSYWLNGTYVAAVEVESAGVTIARALSDRRETSEEQAIEKALARLQSSGRSSSDLTVGG
jgi:hypothetical protein